MHADQAAVTLGNVDDEIGGLTVSEPPTQAEVQALRDRCEELADDVRALATLVHHCVAFLDLQELEELTPDERRPRWAMTVRNM